MNGAKLSETLPTPQTTGLPRLGTPRNPDRPSYGPKIAKLSAMLGKPFLPWQSHVSAVGGEIDPATGRYWYQTLIVHVPRRAGKTVMVFARQTHRALTRPAQKQLYGAQSRTDGLEIWDQQISDMLAPHAARLGYKQRKSIGSERLDFRNGSRISLITPNENVGVGTFTDLVDVDEARFHSVIRGKEIESAIKPTQATRDGQLWIPSSAGTYGRSDWFYKWIERGRRSLTDPTSHTAFFDYSIPDDADPLDLDTVCAYHPAVGLTVPRSFIEQQLADMDPNDFAREYASRWTRSVVSVMDADKWARLTELEQPQPTPGECALAFATNDDRSVTAIASAWRDADGVPHIEILDQQPGSAWFDHRWSELAARWEPLASAYVANGAAVAMADRLERGGSTLTPCNTSDYAVACGELFEAVEAERIRHAGQPDLNDAVLAVAKRTIGERWVWSQKASAAPIVSLEAATAALWAYDHPAPIREQMIIAVA